MASFFKAKTNPYYYPDLLDASQPSLAFAAASIIFNPLFWNTVARNEYHNKTITKILGGRRYLGCYFLGASIFSLGIFRDHLYNEALKAQPTHPLLTKPEVKYAGAALFAAGNLFVLSSMWALGVTGTYLGDYFGILMDHIVTSFPFNVMANPMYWGSSMSFIGVALWFGKPAGLLLSVLVIVVYYIALQFEEPFTANIYAQAEAAKKKSKGGRSSAAVAQAISSATDSAAARTRSKTAA
ncbi:Serine/threonine kinase [Tilletia horrida]|nr:Serine/threonine kinase [Tilletia horrida]